MVPWVRHGRLLATIDDAVRWISPMNYSELDILMNMGPLSLPEDVGERQEQCRWWRIVDEHRRRCRDRKLIVQEPIGLVWQDPPKEGCSWITWNPCARLAADMVASSIGYSDGHRRSSLAPTDCGRSARLDGLVAWWTCICIVEGQYWTVRPLEKDRTMRTMPMMMMNRRWASARRSRS